MKLSILVPALAIAIAYSDGVPGSEPTRPKCRLNVSSELLDDALQAVSRQCNVQFLYFSNISAGKTAPKLQGEYTVDEALRLLLENSGLTSRPVNATTREITRTAVASRPTAAGSGSAHRPGNESGGLEEVIIQGTAEGLVATRVETPLRDISQTISVISGEQMRQQNNLNLYDALDDAVGITSTRRNSHFRIPRSRGFSIGSYTIDGGGGLRSVAHTPAIPIVLLTPDLSGFDHVEVLRGSNALFGADGSPGGAINLIRKRPRAEPAVRFSVSAGSWENYRQEVDATGPLALDGALRGRLVVTNASRNYFFNYADDQRQSVFGVLDYDLTANTLLTVGGSYLKSRSRPFERGLLFFSDGSDAHLPRDTSYTFDWSRFKTRVAEGFLRLEQALGGETRLRINATLIDNSVTYAIGYPLGQLNPATGRAGRAGAQYTVEPYVQTQLNLEATLTGKWWDGRAEWVLGGDHLRAQSDTYTAQTGAYGAPIDPHNFDPADYPYPIRNVTPLLLATANDVATRIDGFFASLRVELTEPWSVTAGLRLTNERVTDNIIYYWSGRGFPLFRDYEYGNVLTPYVGTLFTLNSTWSLYASYADIFQGNESLVRSDLSLLPPSKGITMEGGIKGAWRDGALNGSLALYKVVQRGLALEDTRTPPTIPQCCWTTDGRNEAKGVDLELSGHLAPHWLIGGGYTFNQSRQVSPGNIAVRPASDTTPRHLLKLWTDYDLEGRLYRWTIGGSLHAQSTVAPNDLSFSQKPYAVVSPRVGYHFDGGWRVALTVNNLFDKHYYEGFGELNELWYGEPRNYHVRLDARF